VQPRLIACYPTSLVKHGRSNRTWCISWVFLVSEVSFSIVCFLKCYMFLWSLVATGLSDISSRPFLPRVFWRHFLPPKFCGRAPRKSSHLFSLPSLGSYHVSKLKQQSNDCLTCKEGVLSELSYPHQLEPSNHTREPSPCVLQVPPLFGKHHLIYMHVFIVSVECETVCSQSCVLGSRLSVLPMAEHNGADATYSYNSFTSYSCSIYSWSGNAKR
jgi:hypothetical protein